MAFVHGKNTVVLFGGSNLSAYFNDSSTSESVEVGETTTYGAEGSSKSYIAGHNDGTISLSGLFDGSANAVDEVMTATLGTDTPVATLVASEGVAIGKRVKIASVEQTSHEITSPVADVVSLSAELQATGGIRSAVSLHALGAESSSTASASVDNSASSGNGGTAQIHAPANTRDGNTTVKVQHSADDSVWADLVTFTVIAGGSTASERATVAAGTTVNRYLRANSTLAGSTGTITYTVAFARS
jgi:hypothetical protein